MGYLTGGRIADILGLRRADLDFQAGTAISRAADKRSPRPRPASPQEASVIVR
jgi:integrase